MTREQALEASLKEVIALSDRKHDAWDRAKAALALPTPAPNREAEIKVIEAAREVAEHPYQTHDEVLNRKISELRRRGKAYEVARLSALPSAVNELRCILEGEYGAIKMVADAHVMFLYSTACEKLANILSSAPAALPENKPSGESR